jgi:glycosyltransferase involved in cell wall biosynthesis
MKRPAVLVLGPSRDAISGVATHLTCLLTSPLAGRFDLVHLQVGSEGRDEGVAAKLWRLAASPFQLGAAIMRWNASIVHINTSLDARGYFRDLVYLAVAKLLGARVVYQMHDNLFRVFDESPSAFAPGLDSLARWPDAVVVLSEREAQAWRARGAAPALHVVPNGIDCAPFLRQNRAAPDPAAPLKLIYVGRLAPRKGLLESLGALRLARSRGVAARLVVAGAGPEEPRLREYVRESGLARDVSFVGPAYGEHKARLLAQADVLLLPSYSEGLPYALLEAMAAGVVPVVTPVGAVPEVVGHEREALLVAPRSVDELAAAIARLDDDRALLGRLAEAALQRVRRCYSLERLEESFSAIYQEVGRGQRRQPSALSA